MESVRSNAVKLITIIDEALAEERYSDAGRAADELLAYVEKQADPYGENPRPLRDRGLLDLTTIELVAAFKRWGAALVLSLDKGNTNAAAVAAVEIRAAVNYASTLAMFRAEMARGRGETDYDRH